jgi:hypothetical protein
MRPLRKAILAGAAAIALVGVAGWATAEIKNAHVLDVRLADGSVAHIHYVGDTPPTISFGPSPLLSPASNPFGPESPWAALDRMSQAMDRQVDAMFRELATQPVPPLVGSGLTQVDVGKLPPGERGFTMVSTISGNGLCIRDVQYQSFGDGKPPKVVTRTSGSCSAQEKQPGSSETSAAPAEGPRPEHAERQPI